MKMKNHMRDIIRKNVPSVLRNNELIEGYIDMLGDVFQEIRENIADTAYATDYATAKREDLENLSRSFGLKLNPKLKGTLIRSIIRDAPGIFGQLGTRGALEWALRCSGFRDYSIDEVWVPNPDLIRKGYFRQLKSPDAPRRYDLGRRSYTDFVVGKEYVTETGTFFEGYLYSDYEKETLIDAIPIYGETYKNYTQLDLKNMVGKTPYLLVRIYDTPAYEDVIDLSPFNLLNEFGEELTDEEYRELLGSEYVSPEEKQRIIVDTMRYLIQELQRVATTKIILVTDLFTFRTSIPILSEGIEMTITAEGEEFTTDINQFEDTPLTLSGMIDAQDSTPLRRIGDKRPIGVVAPFIATGEYSPAGRIGVLTSSDRKILDHVRRLPHSAEIVKPPALYEHVIFMDIGARVSFTAPSDSTIIVEGMRNYHLSTERTLITTVAAGQSFNQYFEEYHALVLSFTSGSDQKVTVNIEYPD